ncbi:MAG: rod shape-determining protein MreC [Desulfovibrionaceae bacterium]|nr:rod shape-determining protein MreC [Desulfovibrionaceae bacterium]MBO4794138.1 rod shape-determining protein MreC [Deltaproteobacteria bacterium]
MTPRRLLLIPAAALLFSLGLYSWNQHTDVLDAFSASTGLEAAGSILKGIHAVKTSIASTWQRFANQSAIQQENEKLRKELRELSARMLLVSEQKAELERLRKLLGISPPKDWQLLGAQVLGSRMGPNSPFIGITIDRGYITGATPETPIMTPEGIAGFVFKAGPFTAIALLLTDPGVRIAVTGEKSRMQGILSGNGLNKPMEMLFVPHNATFEVGELLVTSGLDNVFPKGIPVAKIISAAPSTLTPFLAVQAVPLANLTKIEDVLLVVRDPETLLPQRAPQQQPSSEAKKP